MYMRVVSLVPSLTLTLFDLGLDSSSIVGRTPWCIHPSPMVNDITIVGGTKTPTLSKIKAARPTLVVMDRDENPKSVYDWCLEQGIPTFVCDVKRPSDVPAMLRELASCIGCDARGEELAQRIEASLREVNQTESRGTVAPMIWHEPLMAAQTGTYAAGMIEALGFNVPEFEASGTGYPVVNAEILIAHGVEGILLSSEPHEFALEEGEEIAQAMESMGAKRPWVLCIDGEALTWMGSFTAEGLVRLEKELSSF